MAKKKSFANATSKVPHDFDFCVRQILDAAKKCRQPSPGSVGRFRVIGHRQTTSVTSQRRRRGIHSNPTSMSPMVECGKPFGSFGGEGTSTATQWPSFTA